MSFTAEFSEELEEQIDHVVKSTMLTRTDVIRYSMGLGIFLYEEQAKGSRILLKRRWPKGAVEVILP